MKSEKKEIKRYISPFNKKEKINYFDIKDKNHFNINKLFSDEKEIQQKENKYSSPKLVENKSKWENIIKKKEKKITMDKSKEKYLSEQILNNIQKIIDKDKIINK